MVTPGLSLRKSLPCFMARMPMAARSLAIWELSTSCDGRIVDDLVLCRDDLDVGIALFESRQLVLFASPGSDQVAASALYGADHAIDVVVAHAADGEFDGVLRLGVGLLSGLGYLRGQLATRQRPLRAEQLTFPRNSLS